MLRLDDVASLVRDHVLNGKAPFLFRRDGKRQFREAVTGAQDSAHPFWARLRQVVPGHVLPAEGYRRMCGDGTKAISVLSIFAAWDMATLQEAEVAKDVPPASWYVAKANFNALVVGLRDALRDHVARSQAALVHPGRGALYERMIDERGIRISSWSERHVAYACGLGCFGLHGGLITSAGCAGRLMSFIVGEEFDRYAEVPEDPFFHCLLLSEGKCGACIERCPVGAISGRGCDVLRCRHYVHTMHEALPAEQRAGATQACSFCMTGVPCTTGIPRHGGS